MKTTERETGVLNSNPLDSNHERDFKRVNCDYSNLCEKYLHKKKDFSHQFYYIYGARLAKMKDNITAKASKMWGKDVEIKKLADLRDESGVSCVIIGTLFKHQELKPSILKEISEEFQLVPQQKQTRFFSDSDELILEDELQRIKLIGKVDVQSSVTGIVCAVLGKQDENGKFIVDDICWAGPEEIPRPFNNLSDDRWILLVSGLDFAHNADLMPIRLLVDYATGWLGEPELQLNASKISLVIVAGNTVRRNHPDKDGNVVNTEVNSSSDLNTTLKQVDEFLHELAESVDVDLLPGEFDPTNYQLPQQPLHLAMLPKAGRLKSLRSVTNPYEALVDGRLIAGSSGQPVDDIFRYAQIDSVVSILEAMLRWGHYAPTAPDTLACYPYYEDDPFIIESQPDIYFAGNQETFQTKLVELEHGEKKHKTRLISVPAFSKTNTCVLVNLSTLDCKPLTFKVKDLSMEV